MVVVGVVVVGLVMLVMVDDVVDGVVVDDDDAATPLMVDNIDHVLDLPEFSSPWQPSSCGSTEHIGVPDLVR